MHSTNSRAALKKKTKERSIIGIVRMERKWTQKCSVKTRKKGKKLITKK